MSTIEGNDVFDNNPCENVTALEQQARALYDNVCAEFDCVDVDDFAYYQTLTDQADQLASFISFLKDRSILDGVCAYDE